MKTRRAKPCPPEDSFLEVDRRKCSRCRLCVEMCPMDVLRPGPGKVPYMRYPMDCWYCDVCAAVCPRKAIRLKALPYLIR